LPTIWWLFVEEIDRHQQDIIQIAKNSPLLDASAIAALTEGEDAKTILFEELHKNLELDEEAELQVRLDIKNIQGYQIPTLLNFQAKVEEEAVKEEAATSEKIAATKSGPPKQNLIKRARKVAVDGAIKGLERGAEKVMSGAMITSFAGFAALIVDPYIGLAALVSSTFSKSSNPNTSSDKDTNEDDEDNDNDGDNPPMMA